MTTRKCKLQGVALAKKFETMVLSDDRFEIPAARHMGMVVFRLKGENEMTEKLLKKVNGTGKMIHHEWTHQEVQLILF